MPLRIRAALTVAATTFVAAACSDGDSPFDESPTPSGTPFVLIGPPDDVPSGAAVATPVPTVEGETMAPAGELVSLAWLAGSGAYPAVPVPFQTPQPDSALRAAIEDAVAGQEGEFSVIVHHLGDGRYADIDPDHSYYAASLFKAAVLLTAYQQRDDGTLDFAKEVEITEEAAEHDLGTLEYLELEIGDKVTIGDAVKAMIVVSDTTLANLVLQEVGGNAVDATLRAAGASTMSVTTRDLPATAGDMAALFQAIATGAGVTNASRVEMLTYLSQEWFWSGVVAGIPSGTPFVHKSGAFTDATHDVAIVEGPSGPYLIAVLSDTSAEWEPIAAVSAAVWQYFASNP
ncbi:MAG TPA: serine hydrolase [Dehalococcoidia bacterium]|nr:serine hydrolase [Dehalococcoidia bacterium]